jgi:ABC-type lipoprotein release transport system permease subunit
MRSLLFGVPRWDPVALIGAPLVLTLAALAACILPATRAGAADPVAALRC